MCCGYNLHSEKFIVLWATSCQDHLYRSSLLITPHPATPPTHTHTLHHHPAKPPALYIVTHTQIYTIYPHTDVSTTPTPCPCITQTLSSHPHLASLILTLVPHHPNLAPSSIHTASSSKLSNIIQTHQHPPESRQSHHPHTHASSPSPTIFSLHTASSPNTQQHSLIHYHLYLVP